MKIENLSQDNIDYKIYSIKEAKQILQYYKCEETLSGIGKAIDLWKIEQKYTERDMYHYLGFLLGDLLIKEYGGHWVWATLDGYDGAPAVQGENLGGISFVNDSVRKRLHEENEAEREIPSVGKLYRENF